MEGIRVDRQKMRQESSVPVQSRVSIVTLAEMVKYWEEHGVIIETMSQLVSWSVDLAREILVANEKIEEISSIEEAHRELETRRLYQRGMKNRSIKKIANAMTFDNLRMEGVDPEMYAKGQYKTLHNDRSVKSFGGKIVSDKLARAMETYERLYGQSNEETEEEREDRLKRIDKMLEFSKNKDEKYEEIKEERLRIQREEFERKQAEKKVNVKSEEVVTIKEGMSEEEFMRDRAEKDREIMERENAPVDPRMFKLVEG